GYPFHPPGNPAKLRVKHLEHLRTRALILQGTRDSFGRPDEIAKYHLSKTIRLVWVEDGDHSFKPRASSGRTEKLNLEYAIDQVRKFVGGQLQGGGESMAELPVIAGVAQWNPRACGYGEAPEPLGMMEKVARLAAEDSGATAILKVLDAVAVVSIASARYQNAPDALATRLGINPARRVYTTFGGNTAQYLVNHFAREIA